MIEALAQLSAGWMSYFGAAVLQNTVFLVIVFVALHVVRNASAQTRYIVATVGLLKLLLPPFMPSTLLSGSTNAQSSLGASIVTLVRGGQPGVAPPQNVAFSPDFVSLVFLAWLAAGVGYGTLTVVRTWRISRSLKGAIPIADDGLPSTHRHIRLFQSNKIALPMTVGVFPRKIFVPASWQSWSPAFRRAVIRHEFAHIARLDGLVQLAETIATALYFFHPLVWVLNRRLRAYREMACDDSSVGEQRFSRIDYSRYLIEVAEKTVRCALPCESVSTLLRRKHEIIDRVRYQTKEGIMRSVPKKRLAVVLAILACCVVPLSWHPGAPARQSTADAKKASGNMQVIDVRISSASNIRIGEVETTLRRFEVDFKNAARRQPDEVVTHLACESDIPMSVLFEVQNALVKNGFTKVEYESGDAGGLPLVLPAKELAKRMESIPEEHIADVYVANNAVLFGEDRVRVDDLDRLVDQRLQQDPHTIVSIHARPDATYRDFVAVLKQVKAGKAPRIFISQPGL